MPVTCFRLAALLLLASCVRCALLAAQGVVPPPPLPPPSPPTAMIQSRQNEEPAKKAPATGPYRIAGRVEDAATGRPIARAVVTLFESVSGARTDFDAQTDDDGKFAIDHMPAGKFRMMGQARGYVGAAYDEHEQYSCAIVTGVAGLDTGSLVLKLQPAASLSGNVTDEAGEPVRHAMVTLFRESTTNGTRRITVVRNANTDDLGNYELTRLVPGTYYITAQGAPWYATHPPDDAGQPNGLGIEAQVDPALDVAYPLMFYPEATDSSSATPITLKAADKFTANFRFTPQPALHITVRSQVMGDGTEETKAQPQRMFMAQLQQKVFDSYQPVVQQRVQTFGNNMEIMGLPPGRYVMRQASQNGLGAPRNVNLSGSSVTVDAADTPSSGTITFTVTPSTTGKAGAKADPPTNKFTVQLVRGDDGDGMAQAASARVKDGHAEMKNVEPGDYRVVLPGRYHVESITTNGRTTQGAGLHITGSSQSVALMLGTGSVVLTGYAQLEGKGLGGAMVVLVPAGGDHSIDLYRRDESDLDGSFRFANVLPGNYLLVAIRDGWPLEWGKPEVLEPYLLKAVPVSVPSNGRGSQKIDEGVSVQER